MPGCVFIDSGKCNGCRACIPLCRAGAILDTAGGGAAAVDPARCDGCGECFRVCPEQAVRLSDGAGAVLWILAQGKAVSDELDRAFQAALPGAGADRLSRAARQVLAQLSPRSPGSRLSEIPGASSTSNMAGEATRAGPPSIVAYSVEMGRVLQLAARVAPVDSTVLILGESGTGKEVVARFIHRQSRRRGGPFVNINCGAIPSNLLESELFGYEAGAFTGARREGKPGMIEIASGGTLFLDEISELPSDLQVKLLQVIQERRLTRVGGVRPVDVNIRIISATNRDLQAMVRKGEFRTDLFYRLNVVPITVPPLRERPDDVIPLIYHFLDRLNKTHGCAKSISEEAREILSAYLWPGNVREVENLMERLVVTVEADEIGAADLPQHVREVRPEAEGRVKVAGIMPLRSAVEEVERQIIGIALSEHRSTYKAAAALGVNQSTVVRKMRKYAARARRRAE